MLARARIARFVILVAAVFQCAVAQAGDPSSKAFLRMDVGRHTAQINRIATDRDETFVVTASQDKTLRVWSATDGSAAGVIRVPIEDGWEGALYAVAVSPDGKTLLAAGITGSAWDNPYRLYKFDLGTRAIVGMMRDLPGVVNEIAYSPDGRFVALGLGGTGKLEIRDAERMGKIAEDTAFKGFVTSLSFDGLGRLAVVADDGILRLYAAETFARSGQAKLAAAHPESVAITRDGSRIAVGFGDRPAPEILGGKDLKHLSNPEMTGGDKGVVGTVAWVKGPDGVDELVGGGLLTAGPGKHIARRWPAKGKSIDQVIAGDTVTHILPSVRGGYLFASAAPSWGRVTGAGDRAFSVDPVTADFRDAHDGRFAFSPNGLAVSFRPYREEARVFSFNLADRRLVEAGADRKINDPVSRDGDAAFLTTMVPDPAGDATALKITDWKNNGRPKLGKRALTMSAGDVARSLAATPDRSRFVLGTEFTLRLYDKSGDEIAHVELPSPAWTTAISRDGTRVIAALGDGTIRWFSLEKERAPLSPIVAFFPHGDGKRWVAWTPEGFFDRSNDGGGEFVGFHFNVGKAKTDWMEFDRVYRAFLDSGLVNAKLEPANDASLSERLAQVGDLRQNAVERPQVRLVDYCLGGHDTSTRGLRRDAPADVVANDKGTIPAGPSDCRPVAVAESRGLRRASESPADSRAPDLPATVERVTLRFVVKSPGGYGGMKVFRNDRNASDDNLSRGLSRVAPTSAETSVTLAEGEEIHEAVIPLDVGRNSIRVQVFNKTQIADRMSDELVLNRSAPAKTAATPAAPRRMFLLAAGVNEYTGTGISKLGTARADATEFAKLVGGGIPDVFSAKDSVVKTLLDQEVSKKSVLDIVSSFRDQANMGDFVVLYLAGHGDVVPAKDNPALSSFYFVSSDVVSAEFDDIRARGISGDDLVKALSGIRARDVLLILDTCHSGQFAKTEIQKVRAEIGNPNIWAASMSTQAALDSYNGSGHGMFFSGVLRSIDSVSGADPDVHEVPFRPVGTLLETMIPSMSKKAQSAVILQLPLEENEESVPLIAKK